MNRLKTMLTLLALPLLLASAGCAAAGATTVPSNPPSSAAPAASPQAKAVRASANPPAATAKNDAQSQAALPKADHVVIVVEENHSYREIVGNRNAPYMNQLMRSGASLDNHYAIEHPSQPNYMDLFSGSNQGFKDDKSHPAVDRPNLGSELIAAGPDMWNGHRSIIAC